MAKTNPLEYMIAVVRIGIGWHFLYEGLVKLMYARWQDCFSGWVPTRTRLR
jgi:uncharacterized membrane protein YphA (DoxX/SURF4 family)